VADLLVAQNMRKEFGGLVAVDNVDFTVPEGGIVSLIGPNGAGKTTFFNMLTGVYKPTSGTVWFAGEDLTGKPPHVFTQRGIARTFQNIRLFQNMTALENVLVGMHSRLTGNIVRSIIRTPGLRRGSAAASSSRSRACASGRRSSRRTSATATSGGSRSRARWRRSRSSCSSTSRRPA
jgi:branched-chain amino acid transport system ATP-binding protein